MLNLSKDRPLSHNELISRATAAFGHGSLTDYEIADFYSAGADAPIQIAARSRKTGAVKQVRFIY